MNENKTVYRLLTEGEIIEKGDEFWDNAGDWRFTARSNIGTNLTNLVSPYRRPLSPEPATGSPNGGNTASVEQVEPSETGNTISEIHQAAKRIVDLTETWPADSVEEFKRYHHNPIVASLNKQIRELENLVEVYDNQWIPIAERKPTEQDDPDDYIEGRRREGLLYRKENGGIEAGHWFDNKTSFTHWCRIPAFKKEEALPETPTTQGEPSEETDGPPGEKELMKFINATPVVLSCLYDIDLMPEQVERRSKEWCHMLVIASHFRDALNADQGVKSSGGPQPTEASHIPSNSLGAKSNVYIPNEIGTALKEASGALAHVANVLGAFGKTKDYPLLQDLVKFAASERGKTYPALAQIEQGSGVSTSQAPVDDGREPKSLEKATLISALRKIDPERGSLFQMLADELERN